jgi:adenylate cyclase
MPYFPEPGQGVIAALEMVEGLATEGLPPAHVGLHAGPTLFQEGDYYGRTVNVASRIANYAARRGGGQPAVADAAGSEPVSFTEIGAGELKGVSRVVRLYTAGRRG